MKQSYLIGVVLVLAGGVVLACQGFSYTSRDKVVDAGPIQITADRTHSVPLPPILGALAILAGIVVLVAGGRSR
jgi:uncharacterized membrane protein HdeD (DUF308 family)